MADDLGVTTEPNPSADAAVGSPNAAPSAPSRQIVARLLLLVGVVALLVSPRYAYWTLFLEAPQYPKGLSISIYPDRVGGDVTEIDGLNHYIGMRKIDAAAPLERRLGIPAIVTIAGCLVVAALWRSRWAVLLVIPAILFPPMFLGDLYWWLRDSGLNLDPKAAFSSSIKPFVPQLLGVGKIAQFRTTGSLGLGYYLCAFSGLAALFYVHQTSCPLRALRSRLRGKNARVVGLVMVAACWGGTSAAATLTVEPGKTPATIPEALRLAAPGDTIVVKGGVHPGPLVVDKSVRLIGENRPILDGRGKGTVVRIDAPDTLLRGFAIRSSGDVLSREDVGVVASARGIVVEDNQLDDVLFGIYLRQAPRGVVRNNTVRGKALPLARRGDLIRLWYSNDVTIEGNTTTQGRDVVLWYSGHLTIRDNTVSGGRYGLHFMYCNDAVVSGNRLFDNSVGAFLMYSARLRLEKNWVADNRGVSGYGIGLKDMEDSTIRGNVLAANRAGLFLEHATGTLQENYVAGNDTGVILFPSAQGNRFEANSFLDNGDQVEIEGFSETMTTNVWEGNYWSDYRGFDRDGDGFGDLAYQPSRLFERLTERAPALRLFAASPSVQAIDFAAGVFPVFEPKSKFRDEHPRMRPLPPALSLARDGGSWRWVTLGAAFLACPLVMFVGQTWTGSGSRFRGRVAASSPRPETLAGTALNPGAPPPAAIVVSGLTKRFGKTVALDDVSFEVRQGETVTLWGPNGAGKTTVLRCLLGLLPCQGRLSVMGEPCGPRGRASRQQLGYVPQEVRLHAEDSVRDTIQFYARLRGVALERGERLMSDWGLADAATRPVRHLSGGMKQKLALVVALLSDPPVLLLDEPTSNLDARTRREFADLLLRLKSAGKTLLFCTHRPSEVWKLADRVVVLERGRKVSDGTPELVHDQLMEEAYMGLVVPSDQADLAASRLAAEGFAVDQAGARLWVEVGAGRKLEAIDLLRSTGIPVLDFDLESDRASGSSETSENGGRRR